MMSSLKRIVYQITCSRCDACYVGQTDRHIHTRFKEHLQPSKPVGQHFNLCGASSDFFSEDVCAVIQSTHRSILYLETLEAIWQRKIKPKINTRDEFRKRELTIKFWPQASACGFLCKFQVCKFWILWAAAYRENLCDLRMLEILEKYIVNINSLLVFYTLLEIIF